MEALFREEQARSTALLGPLAGKVGAFEGALYEATGYYRPQADCIMFTRDEVGFCAVCRRAIEATIDRYAPGRRGPMRIVASALVDGRWPRPPPRRRSRARSWSWRPASRRCPARCRRRRRRASSCSRTARCSWAARTACHGAASAGAELKDLDRRLSDVRKLPALAGVVTVGPGNGGAAPAAAQGPARWT